VSAELHRLPVIAAREGGLPVEPPNQIDQFRESARWIWRVVWRGKYLILASVVLALVPTALWLQQTTPLYTATALVVIDAPEATDALVDRPMVDTRARLTESVIQTEVQIITSKLLAQRVVDKLRLAEDPEFNPRLRKPQPLAAFLARLNPKTWLASLVSTPAQPLSAQARLANDNAAVVQTFQSRLHASMQRRSFLISVSFVSENREKAAHIANTVTELYVTDRLEASFEEAQRLNAWLAERLESLKRDVNVAETAVEEYRAAHNLRRKGERGSTPTDQEVAELNSRLVIARAEMAPRRARLEQVRALTRSQAALEASPDVMNSPMVQRLREQETQLLREMTEASKIYGERHPRMVGFRADLDQLRAKTAAEIEKIVAALSNEVEAAQAAITTLERQLAAVQARSNQAGEAEVRLRELERQADASRSLYEGFLARFMRDADRNGIRRANARIISDADVPGGATFPRKGFTLNLVFMLSLTFGLALVFLLDRLDNTIRSSDEAEELAGVPAVAIVPRISGEPREALRSVLDKPRSALADAVRTLRVSLDLAADQGHRAKHLLVTSSVPREGKTFVTLCLAAMYTKADERVLLIDSDVHRPRLHTLLDVPAENGLVQVLAGKAAAEDVILRQVHPGMDFMPAGHLSNVADLISEQRFGALIDELTKRYDRIVIDSPPVLAVADARILSRLVDKVVYLVHWDSTPRDAIRTGLELLRGVGAPLHGIVLSQVNRKKHARYGYGDYGHYYGRYREYHAE